MLHALTLYILVLFANGSHGSSCSIGCDITSVGTSYNFITEKQILTVPNSGTISALYLSFLTSNTKGVSVQLSINSNAPVTSTIHALTPGNSNFVRFHFTPFNVDAGDQIEFSVTPVDSFLQMAYSADQDCLGSGVPVSKRSVLRTSPDIAYALEISCSSATSGDPHFYGFKGQKYDVMGQSFEIYNIITAPTLQINSRFNPYYKNVDQEVPTGTMMGEIGIKWYRHHFCVNSNATFAQLDGQQISMLLDWSVQLGEGAVLKNIVQGRMYQISLETPDLAITFVRKLYNVVGLNAQWHFDYKSNLINGNYLLHGLLGQTREDKVFAEKVGAFKYLDGFEDDYRILSNSIFGDDFRYNLYQNI